MTVYFLRREMRISESYDRVFGQPPVATAARESWFSVSSGWRRASPAGMDRDRDGRPHHRGREGAAEIGEQPSEPAVKLVPRRASRNLRRQPSFEIGSGVEIGERLQKGDWATALAQSCE
jgi:hypothetical protein